VIYEINFAFNILDRSEEERPLPRRWRLRNKYYETRVNRLRAIQSAKVDGVMRDEDKIAINDPRDQIVILGRGEA
jgi:hypothetical protein